MSTVDPVFAKRWQELLNSEAPGWMKRGAYRYLLRYLPVNTTDLYGTQKLLASVGIHASFESITEFLRDATIGIEHLDELLVRHLLADAWMEEDETWYVGEKNE